MDRQIIIFGANIPISQQINKIGKYLYKNLGGAKSIEISPNMCDVYFYILYQLPYEKQFVRNEPEVNKKIHEMLIDVNITTYRNQIRVNTIEVTPEEKTLGFDLFDPAISQNLEYAKNAIFDRIVKRVSRAYKDYNFLIY